MDLNELLKRCLFSDGVFWRIDIPIRYMAVDMWVNKSLTHPLWWRMQYAKLWYWWGNSNIPWGDDTEDMGDIKLSDIARQQKRLSDSVDLFKNGSAPSDPITFSNDYSLLDGSHRLAGYMYFNFKEINYTVSESPGPSLKRENRFLLHHYTDEEYGEIVKVKNQIISDLEAGRWAK
jgi:hypothetical protein